jgi:hypothetical protein
VTARWTLLLVSWLAVACASEAGEQKAFDDSLGTVEVVVAADGFVLCDGRRIPLEAAVLELRQRTRPMSADDRGKFVVRVRSELYEERSEAAAQTQRHANRLVDELFVMGVRQVRYQ